MALHVTHSVSTHTRDGFTPVVVELLQELPSAPASVAPLPITTDGALVEWAFSDDLGRGLLTTWLRPKMYEPPTGTDGTGLMAALEGGNPDDFRLRVTAGTARLFEGRPDLQQFDHPIRGVGAETYEVTFNDGLREAATRRRTIGGRVLPFTLLDVAFDYPGEAGVVVAHPWRPTLQTPDGPDLSLFDRVTIPTPALDGKATTYAGVLQEMLTAFLANVGYSPSTGKMVYQYVRLGRGGADYEGAMVDSFGDPFTLPVRAHEVLRVGRYQTEQRGSVYVEVLPENGYAGLSTTTGASAPSLDDVAVVWPYVPDGTSAREIQTNVIPGPGLYTGPFSDTDEVVTPYVVGGNAYPDEAVARILYDWLGQKRIRIKDATVRGFVDPMLPFTATVRPGEERVFRAIRGRWDLRAGLTRNLEAFEVGMPA